MTQDEPQVHRGLNGVYFDRSATSDIDGHAGELRYRGYSIHDLAERSTFEEVAYLLFYGDLPTRAQLETFDAELKAARTIPREAYELIRLVKTAHPMDVLRTVVSAMATWDPDTADNSREATLRKAIRLTAQVPTIIAAHHRIRQGLPIVPPTVEAVREMLTGTDLPADDRLQPPEEPLRDRGGADDDPTHHPAVLAGRVRVGLELALLPGLQARDLALRHVDLHFQFRQVRDQADAGGHVERHGADQRALVGRLGEDGAVDGRGDHAVAHQAAGLVAPRLRGARGSADPGGPARLGGQRRGARGRGFLGAVPPAACRGPDPRRAARPFRLRSAALADEKRESFQMAETFTLHVNGKTHRVQAEPDMPLLYVTLLLCVVGTAIGLVYPVTTVAIQNAEGSQPFR